MEIYFENEPVIGVNVTYDHNGQRHYDYFPSLYLFKVWANAEFAGVKLVEVTDDNYHLLAKDGKI